MRRFITVCLAILCLYSGCARADGIQGDEAFLKGDYAVAYREWRQAAEAGDASAMAAVGVLYDTGHGVGQDFAMALAWYRRAAEAGNVAAMFNVGAMYDNGRGTAMDRNLAIYWYERAAQKGSGRAAYNLGVIYRDGDGVPRDKAAAISRFRLALEQGLEAARANLVALGVVMGPPVTALPRANAQSRSKVPRNADPAALLAGFEKVALERGAVDNASADTVARLLPDLMDRASGDDPMALYDLGYAFERGLGVPIDMVHAYVYYLRAAALTDARIRPVALQGASDVGNRLTGEQHASARAILIDGLR